MSDYDSGSSSGEEEFFMSSPPSRTSGKLPAASRGGASSGSSKSLGSRPEGDDTLDGDLASVDSWLRDISEQLKTNNDIIKADIKKAMRRLRTEGARPFSQMGQDFKRINDRIVAMRIKRKSSKDPMSDASGSAAGDESATVAPSDDVLGAIDDAASASSGGSSSVNAAVAAPEIVMPQHPVSCPCAEHYDTVVLDEVFPAFIDTVDAMMWASGSPMMGKMEKRRRLQDVSERIEEADGKGGYVKRVVRYNFPVKNPMCTPSAIVLFFIFEA